MECEDMTGTTIAQALRHAKKLKGRIDEARGRAAASVSFFVDSPPAFPFEEQATRAEDASRELAELQGRLAVANATHTIDIDGKRVTLSHAVRILQALKGQIAWLRELATKNAAQTVHAEVVYTGAGHQTVARQVECRLPEAAKAAIVDSLQERFDLINALVEAQNQTVTI